MIDTVPLLRRIAIVARPFGRDCFIQMNESTHGQLRKEIELVRFEKTPVEPLGFNLFIIHNHEMEDGSFLVTGTSPDVPS